ncbi:MAG: hypothetical protein DHS20C15_08460 [Planctomycetota bacterium]|nr:MAG: hypothetical protein DHS20C15_08460 [Planctomycetota bacterium]
MGLERRCIGSAAREWLAFGSNIPAHRSLARAGLTTSEGLRCNSDGNGNSHGNSNSNSGKVRANTASGMRRHERLGTVRQQLPNCDRSQQQ